MPALTCTQLFDQDGNEPCEAHSGAHPADIRRRRGLCSDRAHRAVVVAAQALCAETGPGVHDAVSVNVAVADMIARYRGILLGLAAGDALGTTLEFRRPGTFAPIADIVGGGPFNLPAGAWTDDTSMALCLAESLIERRGFDPVDQLERYVR